MSLWTLLTLTLLGALGPLASAQSVRSAAHAPFPAYESSPRRPVLWTRDGRRVLALNPADHRLEIYAVEEGGLAHESSVFTGMEPVALAEAEDGRVWVANSLSDTVVRVDLDRAAVDATLQVGDEPSDVLLTAGRLFVACARAPRDPARRLSQDNGSVEGVLQVYDAAELRRLAQIELDVVRPRALAAAGEHVFVVPQHSGNRTSILAHERIRPRPMSARSFARDAVAANPALFSPRLAEQGMGWAIPHTGRILNEVDAGFDLLPDRDVIAVHVQRLEVAPEVTVELGSSLFAIENLGGRLWVAGLRGFNLFRTEPRLRGAAFDNAVWSLEAVPGGNIDDTILLDDYDRGESYALPTALAGVLSGERLRVFVAAQSSGAIVELDPDEGLVGAVPTAGLPAGLCTSPDGSELVAWCRAPLSLVRYAVEESGLRELGRLPLPYDPEPPLLARGRNHLYEARGAHGNGSFGCVSCHQSADHDMMAWNLGDPGGGLSAVDSVRWHGAADAIPGMHPVKGPTMTQSLRGLDGVQAMHWRGDRPFVQSFRRAFQTLQDGEGISLRDAQELATYLGTLRFPPNPHARDPDAGRGIEQGEELFRTPFTPEGPSCADCHRRFDTDTTGALVGRIFGVGPQAFKAPDLRGVYQKEFFSIVGFGLGHEGSGRDLEQYLPRHPAVEGLPFAELDAGQVRALAAFVRAFHGGEHPWIGRQWPLVSGPVLAERWFELRGRRESDRRDGAATFDLVIKLFEPEGAGEHGFCWVDDDSGRLLDDQGGAGGDLGAVMARMAEGATGFLLVVPPGTQRRLGIDRDEDGAPDGAERVAGTSRHDPDSDDDGYTDGQEWTWGSDPLRPDGRLAADDTAPMVQSHEARAIFASTATLDVRTDEPCSLQIELDVGAGAPRRVVSFPLRRHHQVLLDALPAGSQVGYRLWTSDRSGNETPADAPVQGSLHTAAPCYHVDALEVAIEDGRPVAKVRVVDQDGRPAPPLQVQLLWHFAGGRNDEVAQRHDVERRVLTAEEGLARCQLEAAEVPRGRISVSVTVTGISSADGRDRSGSSFHYEQAVDEVSVASVLLL